MKAEKIHFFTKHAKSSAVLVSVGLHVLVLIVAISFVAVSVIDREDQTFEAAVIKRPKMKLRKLMVPVKISKKSEAKPKLRKQILAKKMVKTTVIRMPEVVGFAGGTGYLDGAGGFDGIGLGLDINFFGIMGGGDHIVFVIDFSGSMRGEKEMIMRREAVRVVNNLPAQTKFGVIFFAGPAWPASSSFSRYVRDWVQGVGGCRPKDWNDMPRVKYQTNTKSSRSKMVRSIEDTPLSGGGTIYDCPLYMALSMDPIPDTIFFMTDGACDPKRGIDSFRIMIDQLNAAEMKVPTVHTVGFGISSNEQLTAIASLTGGECNFLTTADYVDRYGPSEIKPKRGKFNYDSQRIKSVAADEYPVEFDLSKSES